MRSNEPVDAEAMQIIEEQITEAKNNLHQAVALINGDLVPEAIELLTHVLSVYMSKYGQTALECAPAYFRYGQALLFQAQDAEKDNVGMDASSKNEQETQQGINDVATEEEEDEESEESEDESDEDVEEQDENISKEGKKDESCEIVDKGVPPLEQDSEKLQSDQQQQLVQQKDEIKTTTTGQADNIHVAYDNNKNKNATGDIKETVQNQSKIKDKMELNKEVGREPEEKGRDLIIDIEQAQRENKGGDNSNDNIKVEEDQPQEKGRDLTIDIEQAGDQNKGGDDQNDDMKTEEEEEELSDVEQNLQSAWEYLETARYIYEQNGSEKYRFQLAEIRSCLGDVSAEQEDFETAISDFKTCLELLKSMQVESEKSSQTEDTSQVDNLKVTRRVAETHFKLALAMQFSFRYREAMYEIDAAWEMLNRLANELANSKDGQSDENIQENLNELKGSIEDLTAYKSELKALESAGGVARIKSAIEAAQKVADKEVSNEANDSVDPQTKNNTYEAKIDVEEAPAVDNIQSNENATDQQMQDITYMDTSSPTEAKENQGLLTTNVGKQEIGAKRSRSENEQIVEVLGEKNDQHIHKKLKCAEVLQAGHEEVNDQ